jgi:hypothetical protein
MASGEGKEGARVVGVVLENVLMYLYCSLLP